MERTLARVGVHGLIAELSILNLVTRHCIIRYVTLR